MPRESSYQNAHTLFQEGKAAMIINGPWSWADYRKSGIDLGIAPLCLAGRHGIAGAGEGRVERGDPFVKIDRVHFGQ